MSEDHENEEQRARLSPSSSSQESVSPAIAAEAAQETTGKGIGRFPAFLRASWSELQRVTWPDRTQVAQGTGVTLVFVVIAGLFLGAVDAGAGALVKQIIDL